MAAGIPGLQHVDYAALTVPNLDEAVAFYCEVIGGRSSTNPPPQTFLRCPGNSLKSL